MLTALTDQQLPPETLLTACAAHYKATGSVQLMDPVVGALNKDSVVQLLPKLLTQLPDQRLRLLYRRLALAQHGREAMFAPVELLVLLHRVTSEMPQAMWKAHNLQIISAVDRAMRTPEVFPAAIMQMVSAHRGLLPLLLLLLLHVDVSGHTCFCQRCPIFGGLVLIHALATHLDQLCLCISAALAKCFRPSATQRP
jgi:hypothetical protein